MRRNNLDIEADILDVAREGSIKTWIVYGANLNFNIVKKYLKRLIDKGFMVQDGKIYRTTAKGLQYKTLIEHCKGFQ